MAQKKKSRGKFIIEAVLGTAYVVMRIAAKRQAVSEDMDADNSYLDRQGRSSCGSDGDGMYVRAIKPAIDKILSFGRLVLLAPVFAVISIVIYLDGRACTIHSETGGKGQAFL